MTDPAPFDDGAASPLFGLRVLDLTRLAAGNMLTHMLADFGADVIKVEIPGVGDQYRTLSAIPGLPEATSNYMWEMDARNKRSITLNLKAEAGVEILHKLVSDCDVTSQTNRSRFVMRSALTMKT